MPFSFLPVGHGRHDILGIQPIQHRFAEPNVTLNITQPGHWFNPGRVVHTTFSFDNSVYFYTRGVGTGWNPDINRAIGYTLFGKMHGDVVNRIQTELLGQPYDPLR